MCFYINVSSKDKSSLLHFLNLVSKIKDKSVVMKFNQKKTGKKIITVLKSPHVNKSAQEQFEYRTYTTKILISSLKPFKYISIIKKLKNESLPGIHFKIDFLTQKPVQFKNSLKKRINPSNFKLKIFEKNSSILKNKSVKNYLKLFDFYGDFILKPL